jgi:hypothetical protein
LKKVEKFRKKTNNVEEKIEENRNRIDNSDDFPLR